MADITKWAENLTKEIYSEYINKYSFWKHGIKVFYSPVVTKPDLMIISYQPGGTEKNYIEEEKDSFEKGDFHLQAFNSYVETTYTMSRRVRSLFDFDSGFKILSKSVVFPLIFFRAPTISAWRKELPKQQRVAMEEFCFSKVKEIIQELQPKKILILGVETYDQLKEILGDVTDEKILHARNNGGTRMAISSKCNSCSLFAVSHPSGSRISKADWNFLRELLKEELSAK